MPLKTDLLNRSRSLMLIGTFVLIGTSFLYSQNTNENDVIIYSPQQPISPAPDKNPPVKRPPTEVHHVVVSGETLWRLSKIYRVPVDSIKQHNNLTSDLLKIGQVIRIPNPQDPPLKYATPQIEVRKALPVLEEPIEVKKAEPIASQPDIIIPAEEPTPPPHKPEVESKPNIESEPPEIMLRNAFIKETQKIASQKVSYSGRWTPQGESASWVMDCSNTVRYLYKAVRGINIPRTASDQYHQLRLINQAWPPPKTDTGEIDVEALKSKLQIGDLLFWEHTYAPEREPPVTHVMIYLGPDKNGKMIMTGSQQSAGLLAPSISGPDLYIFDPNEPKGGHYRWLLFSKIDGYFSAYGRPPESKR